MSDLVDFLCDGEHPVEAGQRQKTREEMKQAIERGWVHVKFTDTRGGTELGVPIDRNRCDLRAIESQDGATEDGATEDAATEDGASEIRLVGDLTLDYVPVTCFARIDLSTLRGEGHLQKR